MKRVRLSTYRLVSIIIVLAAAGLVVGVRMTDCGDPAVVAREGERCACEWPAGASKQMEPEPPKIPPVPGLPCVIQFGLHETADCEAGARLLASLQAEIDGEAGVLVVDTRQHRDEASHWRLRMVPTQLFLNAKGEEVSRHEGPITRNEVLAGLRGAGARIP